MTPHAPGACPVPPGIPDGLCDPCRDAGTPHHPSTADLAALRWTFHEADPRPCPAGACPVDVPRDPETRLPVPGAYAHELERGIGHAHLRPGVPLDPYPGWTCQHTRYRRDAAADRSQAFHRIAWEAAGDAGLALDMLAAIAVFEPR